MLVTDAFGQLVARALKAFLNSRFRHARFFGNFLMRQIGDDVKQEHLGLLSGEAIQGIGNRAPRLLSLQMPLGRRLGRDRVVHARMNFAKAFGISSFVSHVVADHMQRNAPDPTVEGPLSGWNVAIRTKTSAQICCTMSSMSARFTRPCR